jgi:hypothetical protein
MTGVRVLERVARNAPLGLRFWDVAGATSTVYGLRVEVFPRANPRARTLASINGSGVYVTHHLPMAPPPPGPREFEFSDSEPDELWPATTRGYRVEVSDPDGRFLPVAFDADLPARGLFTWRAPWLSPPEPVALPTESGSPAVLLIERVPLFSAPSRPVPSPLAVVYAQLRELGSGQDAAWCLLTVAIDGVVRGVGLADAQGRIAVIFPYPEPPRMSLASPPEARNDFTWQLALSAFGFSASPPGAVPAVPDLADIFASLSTPRTVVESTVSPSLPFRLTYREALTARTAGTTGADASLLLVS